MKCKYFGKCGSCTLFELFYQEQLEQKKSYIKKLFKDFYQDDIELFASASSNFRNRAEFRIWHTQDGLSYAMSGFDKKRIVQIDSCQIVQKKIADLMLKLIRYIEETVVLKEKLFGVEFLSGDRVLTTLLYHKNIDEDWRDKALELQTKLDIDIIGRSRGVRIVVGRDYVYKKLTIDSKEYIYKVYENSFLQPNDSINQKMIEWVKKNIKDLGGDLLELYCGHGNFTIALSKNFKNILATEVSKKSIKAAKENCELNGVSNITFVRLSDSEIVQAIDRVREFRRLEGIELDNFNFSAIFVDPPRAGVNEDSIELMRRFEHIIYISCNPTTLKRDIKLLKDTHKVIDFAIFDQFAYTTHIECGVVLKKL